MASRSEPITGWRIVKKRYAASAFDGEGARRFGGRWHSVGTAVVYVSESRALSLLEVLAGLGSVAPLSAYVIVPLELNSSLVLKLQRADLFPDWLQSPPPPATQQIGDAWVKQRDSVVLRVPSAIVPEEYNYILNPAHPEFRRVQIGEPQDLMIDPRLVR